MASDALTDYDFWKNYWLSKDDLIFPIPSNYTFTKELTELIEAKKINALLEIGGFPGYYSVWAGKKFGIKSTLLDFVILKELVVQLKNANQYKGEIDIWEKDLFSNELEGENSFDLVISNGLIEHFKDTQDIIERHVRYLNSGGQLFISLPNFKGLNGWFQKTFDPENYAKHHIPSMDIAFLQSICENLHLKNIHVNYTGGFMLWLENETKQPIWVKAFKKTCWLPIKIFFTLVPIQIKAFAPYILIKAEK
jgi:SAM-dependent methyltransferase